MKVLSDKRNADIITWMPSGKSFSILKPKLFVAQILPAEFKTAKFSSFTRKLHRWGFMRHYRGEEAGAYYHQDFQKGNLELVEKMACHRAQPTKSVVAIAAISKKAHSAVDAAAAADQPKVSSTPKRAPAIDKTIPWGSFNSGKTTSTKPTEFKTSTQIHARPCVTTMTSPATALPSLRVSTNHVAPNAVALPPMIPQLTGSATNMAAYNADRLHAAIELEVNRRIEERINAMEMSRQAFAMSALRQQQLMTQPTDTYSQLAAAYMLQKQGGGGLANVPAPTTAAVAPGPGDMGYRATTGQGRRSMPSAPPTNIQGARTA